MAKHAKPYVEGSEQMPWSIVVKRTDYAQLDIDADTLDEAVALARDILSDNKVLWQTTKVELISDILIENHYQ